MRRTNKKIHEIRKRVSAELSIGGERKELCHEETTLVCLNGRIEMRYNEKILKDLKNKFDVRLIF